MNGVLLFFEEFLFLSEEHENASSLLDSIDFLSKEPELDHIKKYKKRDEVLLCADTKIRTEQIALCDFWFHVE